jgi:hypothetical protein
MLFVCDENVFNQQLLVVNSEAQDAALQVERVQSTVAVSSCIVVVETNAAKSARRLIAQKQGLCTFSYLCTDCEQIQSLIVSPAIVKIRNAEVSVRFGPICDAMPQQVPLREMNFFFSCLTDEQFDENEHFHTEL